MAYINAYHSLTLSPKGGRLSGRQKVLYVLGLGLRIMVIINDKDRDGVLVRMMSIARLMVREMT